METALQYLLRTIQDLPKNDGCLEWPYSRGSNGYGLLMLPGQISTTAHRQAWIAAHSPIPETAPKTFVLHRCDNRLCYRPDHLFLGTNKDNMADMVAKGRSTKGRPSPKRGTENPNCRGEKGNKAKLTEDQVRSVFSRFNAGESQSEIGRSLGVSQAAIWLILYKQNWKHLGLEPPTRKPRVGNPGKDYLAEGRHLSR